MKKKILFTLLATALLLGMMPGAFAASDINGHWAKTYIEAMDKMDVINPAADGTYLPEKTVTRAEFMNYINRAFGFTEKSTINFTDVPAKLADGTTPWYYETIQIAVHYGYINGTSPSRMTPTGTITREQAATILGRLQKYEPKNTTEALAFSDKGEISSWSGNYIAEATANGYINGYEDGTFRPNGAIVRGEVAKILYYYVGTRLSTSGTDYKDISLQKDTKNVSITAACTLSSVTVPGNIYITEGVGNGTVILNNVSVGGKIIVSGGSTVVLNNVTASELIEATPLNGTQQIECTGTTSIDSATVKNDAKLVERELDGAAGGFSDLTLDGSDLMLTLDASVWDVTVKQPANILTSGSTTINKLTANAKTAVSGGGEINRAELNATGSSITMKPASYELASGVSAEIAGEKVSSPNSVALSPASFSYDRGKTADLSAAEFSFSGTDAALSGITSGGAKLTGNDYSVSGSKLTLSKTYLQGLAVGAHTLKLSFEDGASGVLTLNVTDSSVSAVTPASAIYDKYTGAEQHKDVSFRLNLTGAATLSNVRMNGTTLALGKAYTYNASTGVVTLLSSYLSDRPTGNYALTFALSSDKLSASLSIVDTAPANTVAPSALDFDANTAAGGYTDKTVTLAAMDGAKLSYIKCGSTRLEEDWHYKVSGNQITLNRSAIARFGEGGASYADFVFVMDKGTSPTLRINFVTTYALNIYVTDDLFESISGTSVTVTPADASTGTATQTVAADDDGTALVYVKKGSYVVTATNDRFSSAATQSVSVSAAQSVNIKAQIVEAVTIAVTDQYGAKIADAVVSIDGQSAATGTDGTATFSLLRGSYTLQVAADGYVSASQQLTVNGPVSERVRLENS